jgi:hypothetical protein
MAGTEIYSFSDEIAQGSSETYVQASMDDLGASFNGSAVVSSDQPVAAIVNQSTSNGDGTQGYNASYTGFSQGSDTFYVPIVLNAFYGYHTEVSVQNADSGPVDVTVTYDTAGCTDSASDLAMGAVVRFDNTATCAGGLNPNGSATISATGPVVAVVNQISEGANLEQTYNGFAATDGSDVLYTPIALADFYGFNTAFQVQNISGAAMDICATYSDGVSVCENGIADGDAATFIQATEGHGPTWLGSATITSSTGGDMVGIVNQQGGPSAASFNMYAGGATSWALPSLLYQFYGFTSAFQVQNISGSPVDINVTYDDGTSAQALAVADGDVAAFVQDTELGHTPNQAFSAIVEATGDVVVAVNQDALTAGAIDYMYSYNAIPLE